MEAITFIPFIRAPLKASAGHGRIARINNGHPPRLGAALVNFHAVFLHVEGDVRHVQAVIGEIFLDHVTLVTGANDKVVDTMGGIALEHMSENRAPADFDHGLGLEMGFFTDASAKTAGKDDCYSWINIQGFRIL